MAKTLLRAGSGSDVSPISDAGASRALRSERGGLGGPLVKCDFFELPVVASILFGKGNWSGTDKDRVERIERFFFVAFLLCFSLWFSNFAPGLPVLSREMLPRQIRPMVPTGARST